MTDALDFTLGADITSDPLLDSVTAEISAVNDLILPDEMVIAAVERACDFFEMPEVPVINADGTCVWSNDSSTLDDDVFGFNRIELMSMGISGEDSLTLIYTHECAHRALQGSYNDSWEEELACDFFAGIHAGIHNINIDNFEAALGTTTGGDSHPNGALRAEFIEYGQKVANDLHARGVEITFGECIEILNEHLEEKEGLIEEYRSRVDSSFSTEDITSAKSFINDADWHIKEAEIAAAKGDMKAYNDHMSSAEMCS